MNEAERRDARRLGFDSRDAARRAQALVLMAKAIEWRVSALGAETPASVVEETALHIKAAALQIAGHVHDLLAQGERLQVQVGMDPRRNWHRVDLRGAPNPTPRDT